MALRWDPPRDAGYFSRKAPLLAETSFHAGLPRSPIVVGTQACISVRIKQEARGGGRGDSINGAVQKAPFSIIPATVSGYRQGCDRLPSGGCARLPVVSGNPYGIVAPIRGCPKTSIQRHSHDSARLLADCVRLLTESMNP